MLTANVTVLLVGAVAASVPAAASYCVRTTSAIIALERTKFRGDSPAITRPARSSGLVAAVPTRHHGVAEFVSR